MRKVIPAIVTGCSVVIKPSEETTLLTLKSLNFSVIQLFHGLIQIVPGTGETVGTQLATHKDIQLVSLTGSMGAGKAVFKNA